MKDLLPKVSARDRSSRPATSINTKKLSLIIPKNKYSTINEQASLSTEASVFRNQINDYVIGKEIGKGAYAIVKQCLHKPTNLECAIKIYEKVKLLDIQRKNAVKREISILSLLKHDSIVKLYEVIDTPKQVKF